METRPETIEDIKEDVQEHRERVQRGLESVRSAIDPRDNIENLIREKPLASVGAAAFAGFVAGTAFIPGSRRSPLGAAVGGMLSMAYRGFFLAATPIFAQKIADIIVPRSSSSQRFESPPTHPSHPVLEPTSAESDSANA